MIAREDGGGKVPAPEPEFPCPDLSEIGARYLDVCRAYSAWKKAKYQSVQEAELEVARRRAQADLDGIVVEWNRWWRAKGDIGMTTDPEAEEER